MTDDARSVEPDRLDTDPAAQRRAIRERYGAIARNARTARDGPGESRCCGETADDTTSETTGGAASGATDGAASDTSDPEALGYAAADVQSVEAAADASLGCGNPTAMASLSRGETVLDLGSGAGFDCFLAAQEVGDGGRVIGVDMTPEMVELARENAARNDATNVEFRLGEIEHLPVADASVDAIVSNCVINLSPDKPRVFEEAYRVLRPGGRLSVSDVVLTAEPPAGLRADPDSVAACVAGASSIPELEGMLDEAGFADVSIEPKAESETFISEWDDDYDPSEFVVSATIEGTKPRT